jgi:hypothetical protein
MGGERQNLLGYSIVLMHLREEAYNDELDDCALLKRLHVRAIVVTSLI